MTTDTTDLAPAAEAAPPAILSINPEQYVAAIYAPFEAKLATAIAASTAAEAAAADLKTTAGYAVAIAQRAVFRDEFRIAIEKARTDRKAPILEIGRLIDAKAKEATAKAKPHEDKWDALIRAEDTRKEAVRQEALRVERERVEAIKARITAIHELLLTAATMNAAEVSGLLRETELLAIDNSYAEFQGDALQTKASTLDKLRALLATKQAQEAEAQRQEAERIAREQAAAAERQRLAEERAAAEQERAKLAEERAELERQQAVAQAALQAQQEELARQQAALAAQQAAAERQAREQREAAERQAAAAKAEEERKARIEADRVAAIRQTITQLRERAMQREVVAGNAAAVESAIATLVALRIAEVDFGEFTAEAEAAREEALAVLRELRGAKVAQEAEADRLAAERAELERQQQAVQQRVGAAFEPVKAALAIVGVPTDGEEDRLRADLLARIRADLECLDNAMLARVAEFAEHLVERTGGRKIGGAA